MQKIKNNNIFKNSWIQNRLILRHFSTKTQDIVYWMLFNRCVNFSIFHQSKVSLELQPLTPPPDLLINKNDSVFECKFPPSKQHKKLLKSATLWWWVAVFIFICLLFLHIHMHTASMDDSAVHTYSIKTKQLWMFWLTEKILWFASIEYSKLDYRWM